MSSLKIFKYLDRISSNQQNQSKGRIYKYHMYWQILIKPLPCFYALHFFHENIAILLHFFELLVSLFLVCHSVLDLSCILFLFFVISYQTIACTIQQCRFLTAPMPLRRSSSKRQSRTPPSSHWWINYVLLYIIASLPSHYSRVLRIFELLCNVFSISSFYKRFLPSLSMHMATSSNKWFI